MKIVASISKDKFLAEITESEIAACCGFEQPYGDEWNGFLRQNGRFINYNHAIAVGCEFHPKKISAWHYNLQYKHKQAKESAGLLRSLADMIEHVPEAFTVPPSESEIKSSVDKVEASVKES